MSYSQQRPASPGLTSTGISGPLTGVRVLELSGVGPTPFAGMMLADLGAEVLRIDRVNDGEDVLAASRADLMARGRCSLALDLKSDEGRDILLALVESHDVLLEGFRPGVCERLGIGPQACRSANERLVFARMTGWGQDGPLAAAAGHDINYMAAAGGLHPIGADAAPPVPPLNFVADFGGGGMLVVVGILAALLERERSGRGQIIDAAMVDGVTIQTAQLQGLIQAGAWTEQRAANKLDGGAPFYRSYQTLDGNYVAVSALEARFYRTFLTELGLDPQQWPQDDRSLWPALHQLVADIFLRRSRDDWESHFAGTDACVSAVMSPSEARTHEHLVARRAFIELDGLHHPAPAPRFSRTPTSLSTGPVSAGQHTREVLHGLGFTASDIDDLHRRGIVRAGVEQHHRASDLPRVAPAEGK